MAASESTTLSSLSKKYRLSEAGLNQQVTEQHINDISFSYCKKWRLLPTPFKMEQIVADDINRKCVDEDEKRHDFLLKWTDEKGSMATYKVLICALLKIKCDKEAEGVCKLISRPLSPGSAVARIEADSGVDETDGDPPLTNSDEQPFYNESMEKVIEPQSKPTKGTQKYKELQQFSKKVVIILQTVNDIEYKAALTVMKPPTASFTKPVIFPKPNMIAGKIGGKKTVLLKAGAGRVVGDYVESAKKTYTNARFVIGVGVCYAFKQKDRKKQCKLGDVLVSGAIRDNRYMKFEDGKVKDLGQKVDTVFELCEIFCMEKVKELDFDVSNKGRESKMHCGTFCCNVFLIKDEKVRDAFRNANADDNLVGGEMEGGELLKLQLDRKVEGVIVIKGVADFADKKKAKDWQFTATKAALHYIEVQLENTDDLEVTGTGTAEGLPPITASEETADVDEQPSPATMEIDSDKGKKAVTKKGRRGKKRQRGESDSGDEGGGGTSSGASSGDGHGKCDKPGRKRRK